MATTHPVGVRNSIVDGVVDQLDVGTTNPAGQIEIQTAGSVEVATLPFSATAFGAASAGVATAAAITDDSSATGGTAAKYEAQNRDAAPIWLGSVTATGGGGDIELSTVTIPAAGTVQMSAMTYTGPS